MENIAPHNRLSVQKTKGVAMKHTCPFIATVLFLQLGCERNSIHIRNLSEIDFGQYSVPVNNYPYSSELGESAKYYLEKYGKKRDRLVSDFVVTNRLRNIRIIVDIAGGMSAVWRTVIVSDTKICLFAFMDDKLEYTKEKPVAKELRMAIEKISEALMSSRGGFLDNTVICDRTVFFVTVYREQEPAIPFVVDGFVDYSSLSGKAVPSDQKKYAVRPISDQEKMAFTLLFGEIVKAVL